VFPVYDENQQLATISRYRPDSKPKMRALSGRDRGLFPSPERFPNRALWLVEGEPDGVTVVQLGLAGCGIPGANGWTTGFAERNRLRFAGRVVIVCFDCDEEGRNAVKKVLPDLTAVARDVRVVDLDPGRSDGFDLSDFHLAGGTREQLVELARQATPIHGLRSAA
jgi:DNA primase